MLLNEITTSDELKIKKINKVLKETFGFTLVSEVKTGTLNTLYTQIADDLYNLKLNLNTAKDPAYVQKLLVLEGLKILIEKNNKRLDEAGVLAGKGSRAFTRILDELQKFVDRVCEMGDDYEEAIKDAMKHYRSSKYRFPDEVVEFELRKATEDDCTDTHLDEVFEADESCNCKVCDCDPCECDKEEVAEDIDPKTGKEYQPGPGMSTRYGDGEPTTRPANNILSSLKPQSIWWENDPEDLMTFIYWKRNQLPPNDTAGAWNSIVKALSKKNPPPADWVNPMPVEEGGDRHAERDWVNTIKQDAGIGDDGPGYYDDLSSGMSLEDPKEKPAPEADDYFSYNRKKRNEMKEGYVKQLRKLLEAETDQAESLIAAKSFSQELQDMVETLGRLVNESLPAVSEQMRDAYGSDVASGFEDQVASTLNGVMDSLRTSKQEIDNSVSTIADGGAPEVSNDMENFSDEELGGEFDDADLDLDSDVELDVDAGDEFGGDDAMAGLEDEPLGRAKKESIRILGKKIVEAQQKLARIKAKSRS